MVRLELLPAILVVLSACQQEQPQTPVSPVVKPPVVTPPVDTPLADTPPAGTAAATVAQAAFQDTPSPPPPDWKGPVFKLSADYPQSSPPACTPATCPWLSVEVNFGSGKAPSFTDGGWAKYMQVILDYVKEGQDPNLANDVGFLVAVQGKTRWYNVPWMAFDPQVGRDFVHGTTNERTAMLSDLTGVAADDDNVHGLPPAAVEDKCEKEWATGFESWSVGYYNDYGGWAIGQAFPRVGEQAGVPQTTTDTQNGTYLQGLPFPEGSMVMKILTTNAPKECVPVLKGATAWQVDRHVRTSEGEYLCKREVQTSHILQVDVAVVDKRSPTRWVYGTFVYDGLADGATFWDRLKPLGVQWGSDPGSWPAVQTSESAPIAQTVLNPAVNTYQHEGCFGRLAGPVDNPASSCVSCHASGFAPAPVGTPGTMGTNEPPIFGFDGLCPKSTSVLDRKQLADNNAYFSNTPYPAPYKDPKYGPGIPMDTSLQLLVAMNQYAVFKTNRGQPNACKDN